MEGPPADPDGGPAQIAPIVDLLLTVAYIDGRFHQREQTFVHQYIDSVFLQIEESSARPGEGKARVRSAYHVSFGPIYARLHGEIERLSNEAMSSGDGSFVPTRLKVRAVKIFRGLTPAEQTAALELVRALMQADRTVTPSEQMLLDELLAYFTPAAAPAPVTVNAPVPAAGPAAVRAAPPPLQRTMIVAPPQRNDLKALGHPLLEPLEQTYSPHPVELQAQVARDYQLVGQAMLAWNRMRGTGNGRLTGITDVAQIPVGARILDGHVHVLRPDRPVELVVLGDLHGCYSCLKAALLQSDFINRVWAHQWDPSRYPDVKLVLLGDYIDRGRFSFDGVLRAALQLLCAMPDHVVMLRGNHEYFLTVEGRTFSGVHPAEALASITPHVPPEMLEAYRILFENMPTSFLCDRTLFVHGGIPRADTFEARYRDLSSLNDPEMRFQMLWSDPIAVDQIPVELQRKNARFSFGSQQFRAFMDRIGAHTMVRGHEQIDRGFDVIYDLGDRQLLSVFSAGGHDNRDLPVDAAYRRVTPMALTIQHGPGGTPHATPWPIQYGPFNHDAHNGLHRHQPLLEFRYA
jgi:Calcineurin-like phosphoesterase